MSSTLQQRYNPLFNREENNLTENRFPKHQQEGIVYLKTLGISAVEIKRLLNMIDNSANKKVISGFLSAAGLTVDELDLFFKLYNF